jgi:hypothetical protein
VRNEFKAEKDVLDTTRFKNLKKLSYMMDEILDGTAGDNKVAKRLQVLIAQAKNDWASVVEEITGHFDD